MGRRDGFWGSSRPGPARARTGRVEALAAVQQPETFPGAEAGQSHGIAGSLTQTPDPQVGGPPHERAPEACCAPLDAKRGGRRLARWRPGRRTVIGLALVAGLMAAFLGSSRLAAVENKSDVVNVLSAGPVSFREHVSTYGVDPAVAWLYSGYNLWLGNAIGMTFAILIGAALVALVIPKGLIERVLARRGAQGSILGGALGSGLFMCANCATPVSMGYYRRGASLETALSVTLASPLLNLVGLLTIFFLLPAELGLWRLVASLGAVFLIPPIVARVAGKAARARAPAALQGAVAHPDAQPAPLGEPWGRAVVTCLKDWVHTVAQFGWRFLPWMILVTWGVALVATYALTPDLIRTHMGQGPAAILLASAVGTLFVTSTMMEIPIVLGFLLLGMGEGPASAMLVTLPATSIMVAAMMGRDTGWRVPAVLLAAVFLLGTGVGLLAELL